MPRWRQVLRKTWSCRWLSRHRITDSPPIRDGKNSPGLGTWLSWPTNSQARVKSFSSSCAWIASLTKISRLTVPRSVSTKAAGAGRIARGINRRHRTALGCVTGPWQGKPLPPWRQPAQDVRGRSPPRDKEPLWPPSRTSMPGPSTSRNASPVSFGSCCRAGCELTKSTRRRPAGWRSTPPSIRSSCAGNI